MLRAVALAAVAAAAVVVVGSSSVWAAAPAFLDADAAPEAKTVTLLAVGEGQTKVGPPVRAVDADGDSLTYSLSDGDPLHAFFFTIDSSSGQISMKPNTRAGVYRVRVSVSDGTDTATVDVTIHVTSPGNYPWEDSWVQARSMTAADATTFDRFGFAVDATSEVIVVGAYERRAAYVFDATSGAQLAKLRRNNNDFGYSVAVAGDTIFVSAPQTSSSKGRVYIFVKPETGWADTSWATTTLVSSVNYGEFGSGLAVSDDGNTLVASAPGLSLSTGSAFVFSKPETGWAYTTTVDSGVVALTAGSRRAQYTYFGANVDISGDGNTIAVSASFVDISGRQNQGAVHVFSKPETGWAATATSTVVPRLTVETENASRHQRLGERGLALSDDGSTLVASAATTWRKGLSDDSQVPADDYGSVYVYVRPSGGWADATETAKLASFGHKYDQFGRGVAISGSGDKIAVGNPWSRSSNFRGSVYVYTKPSEGWSDDLDGAGDDLRILTLANADSEPKHRYAFGSRGLAFIGEDKLVAGQTGYVEALKQKDELSSLLDGGLYGANADHSSNSNIRPGAAHLFILRQAPPRQTVTPPPPPPPPPDDGTAGPGDGTAPSDEPAPPPEFADVDGESLHAQSIAKVAALGIASGTTPTTFSPSEPVTRAQMATFMARTWEAAGRECPTSGILFFDDVDSGSTHAGSIDCVSALGVAHGTADRMFSPSEAVTRAQMAAFLARAWEAAGRTCPDDAGAGSSFDDVPADSTHADGIGCMAALGIARGTAAGMFSPSELVTRAQMATFLANFHEALTT